MISIILSSTHLGCQKIKCTKPFRTSITLQVVVHDIIWCALQLGWWVLTCSEHIWELRCSQLRWMDYYIYGPLDPIFFWWDGRYWRPHYNGRKYIKILELWIFVAISLGLSCRLYGWHSAGVVGVSVVARKVTSTEETKVHTDLLESNQSKERNSELQQNTQNWKTTQRFIVDRKLTSKRWRSTLNRKLTQTHRWWWLQSPSMWILVGQEVQRRSEDAPATGVHSGPCEGRRWPPDVDTNLLS